VTGISGRPPAAGQIEQFTIIVDDYDKAIGFFTGALGFDLVEDSPSLTNDGFDAALERMTAAGVQFLTAPRTEPYGRVAVFLDIAGNRWDLLGPAA
jgi:predicted enzyme related to lactoylglutathione lyase